MSFATVQKVVKIAIVALLVLSISALVILNQFSTSPGIISDQIARPDARLDGLIVLIPKLKNAQVYTADRPSPPSERESSTSLDAIKRRREFRVDTNSLGLRGPELVQSNDLRVLTLGDSVTFGWGVSHEESWPTLLGKQRSISVVNAAMPAFSPDHMAQWTVSRGVSLEPDVVLFCRRPAGDDHSEDGEYVNAIRRIQAAMPQVRIGIVLPPLSTFMPSQYLPPSGSAAWIQSVFPDYPLVDLQEVFSALPPRPGAHMRWQGDAWSIVQQPGGEVLLEGQSVSEELPEEVAAFFEANVDVREPFFFDDGHPDAQGHAQIAAAVSSWLVSTGLVP